MNQSLRPVMDPVTPPAIDADTYRLIVESASDYAIVLLDPEGRIRSWNVGAHRIKGYEADEAIGRHFSIFYPKQALADGIPMRELQAAREAGRFQVEGARTRKDGSRFWANVVIAALRDVDGTLIGFSMITRDLT